MTGWLTVGCLVAMGCVHELPPVAAPDEVMPPIGALPPLPPDRGRVIVDVADGPAQIGLMTTTSVAIGIDKDVPIAATAVSSQPLCTTPCAVDLPPGRHELTFPTPGSRRRLEVAVVDVFAEPTVYRRALGRYESAGAGMVLGIVGVSLGGMSFITGAALFPIGLATEGEDGDPFVYAGLVTLTAGMLVTALGIWGIAASPATVRRGAAVQFPLPVPAEPEPLPMP